MRLILVRHGETHMNREGRVQGISDAPLNQRGRDQAAALGDRLRSFEPAIIYSSPLSRAFETATAIAQRTCQQVAPIEDLRELDVGDLDGLAGAELMDRYPDFMKQWMTDVAPLEMPGGESIAALQERAWATVEQLAEKHPEQKVIAVSHNFLIQSILLKVLGLELNSFRKVRQDLAAISVLEMNEREPVLITMNDRCHWTEDADG